MCNVRFSAIPTTHARMLQQEGLDANNQTPERHISDGDGVPCRHCLTEVAAGDPYLILSYRPFPEAQPYAESGPIFLHADECTRYTTEDKVPSIFQEGEQRLMRGYNTQNRIVYGTGRIVESSQLENAAADIFADPEITYIHVRSAANNCYQCRIERG